MHCMIASDTEVQTVLRHDNGYAHKRVSRQVRKELW